MKVCPRCQKTYTDDNLNFCLEDGSVLNAVNAAPPPPTNPIAERATQQQPQNWNVQPQQQYSMQPAKKSSKAWIWVILILGVVVVLCGGIGTVAYFVSKNVGDGLSNLSSTLNTSNTRSSNSRSNSTTTTSSSNSNSSRSSVDTLDLSTWVPTASKYAQIEYTDGELLVKNNDPKYYYVLAGTDEQKSVGADAVITVRNVNNVDNNLGYGLVFHSMTTPLIQGYAFLIDAKKGRYRVVHHSPSKEEAVINWTRSDAIKTGTVANTLEARDNSGTVDLYINGQKVNSIPNTYGYSDGVIGIYASSSVQVAFTDMELRH
jgi:hypothetical protein